MTSNLVAQISFPSLFILVLTVLADRSLSREERHNHLQQIAFVASELARAGAAVIAAPIAPHEAGRQTVRDAVTDRAGSGSNFFLVHVATPIEHCEKTDRHGVYAQARKGIMRGLPGVDEVFEAPKDANLTVDLTEHSIPQVVHSTFLSGPSRRYLVHLLPGIVLLLETSGLL
jgi:sulfate adenylyltransferase